MMKALLKQLLLAIMVSSVAAVSPMTVEACTGDLPPVIVPSFKLERGPSQARDPGGA
jgi:hypothetical protein